jgi:PAS domain S-box-containing protein
MPQQPSTELALHAENAALRERLDAILCRHTALFAQIIEQAPGGVYVVDAQFRVAQMNAQALPYFEAVRPLIGRNFDEVLAIVWGPEVGPPIASIFRQTLATGERYISPRFCEQRHDTAVQQTFEWETHRITLPDGLHGVVCYFRDVTERERAAAALRKSDEQLRLAITGSELGTWHWDLRTGALEWSERCLKIFGLPTGTAMSYDKFLGALHPKDRARGDDAVQRALQNGSEYRIEFRSVWPDGSIHWVASLGCAYCDALGVPTRMEGIALDITERKLAEAARNESDRQYRALLAASSGVAYRMSADWSTLLPLDGRQLVASSDQPLADWSWLEKNIPPDEHARVRQAISEAIAGKTLFELEHRIWRPDGTNGWTLSHAVPIFDENEDLVAWFGAAADITARRLAEQALADRTELLNGLLQGTTDVIYVKDMNSRIMLANDACAAVARSTSEQLVGKTTEELFPPNEAAVIRHHDKAVIDGGTPIQLEETIMAAGEQRVFLSLKAPLRDGTGRVIGLLGISRDITERKRIEVSLINAVAVAEKANRAKSDFLSSMSHELRTPLNAILGFTQLMASSSPTPTPVQKRSLDQILKGGWYLLDLINELLNLAQIESGKLSLTLEPVSLAEVMIECQAMIEPQAREFGILLTFPSFEVVEYVHADRTRVQQIVINLLSNAIKYNKAQGAVAVEWTLSPPDAVRISVRDTGEGMAPEMLAQLFQPFNRLGQEAGPHEGTGIGLVMTKRLVELMGGVIGVESVVGGGSVFWFELKLASGHQENFLRIT